MLFHPARSASKGGTRSKIMRKPSERKEGRERERDVESTSLKRDLSQIENLRVFSLLLRFQSFDLTKLNRTGGALLCIYTTIDSNQTNAGNLHLQVNYKFFMTQGLSLIPFEKR